MALNDNILGTGTQADPYQVTTVEQFEGALAQRGAYLKIMNNLDFGGVSKRYTFSARYVDGNNKILSNFYILNDLVFDLPVYNDTTEESRNREIENATMEFVIVSYLTQQTGASDGNNYAGISGCYSFEIDSVLRDYDPNLIFRGCDVRVKYYGAVDGDDSASHSGGSIFCRMRNDGRTGTWKNLSRPILNAYNSVFSIDEYCLLPYNAPPAFASFGHTYVYTWQSIYEANRQGIIDNCIVKINVYDKFGWNERFIHIAQDGTYDHTVFRNSIIGYFDIISNTAFHINFIAKSHLQSGTYLGILNGCNNMYNSYFVVNCPTYVEYFDFSFTRLATINFLASDSTAIFRHYEVSSSYNTSKQLVKISLADAKDRDTIESLGFVLKHTD